MVNPTIHINGATVTHGETDSAGIQSIEVGAALLRVLAAASGPMKLTDLAAATGMLTSKAHKYLASFIRCGLVRQSVPSGRYGIGPLAAELGFAALRSFDVVELAQDSLDDLRDRLNTVASLAIWANRGPTVVRRAACQQSVSLVVQLGALMPLLTSAGGRIFAAYLDPQVTGPIMQAELAEQSVLLAKAQLRDMADVQVLLDQVRDNGFSVIRGTVHPGIAAISAAVFDYTDNIVAALTLVDLEENLDTDPSRPAVKALKRAAADLSWRLGARKAETATAPRAPRNGRRRAPARTA